MDRNLFSALLRSLLSTGVTAFADGEPPPETFSEKYCYHPALQACYAKDELERTVSELPERAIWQLQDAVGIRLLLFRTDGCVWLCGPFVTRPFPEKRVRSALISHRLPSSYAPSIRLYYSAFPLLDEQRAVQTVRALIRVMRPDTEEYDFFNRIPAGPDSGPEHDRYGRRFDYDTIRRRYELENRFLRMIEEGDTEHVLAAFDSMSVSDTNGKRYLNSIYYVPEISMAMVRALSRKAAERGGAPLMEIDEITQHAVQAAAGDGSEEGILRNMHGMILELTEAVRRHRSLEGKYSAPIRKAVSYLRLNSSQDVRLSELAGVAGFAPSYLSRLFRREVGVTVPQYVRALRCGQAARLLRETDLPVSDISAYVGYPDNNYFVKAFRAQYGMTPGAWRESAEDPPLPENGGPG